MGIRTDTTRKMSPDDALNPSIRTVAGLGNPGVEYAGTRHNIGFQVVDQVADRWRAKWHVAGATFAWAEASVAGSRLLLIKPLTYMNRSGPALAESMQRFGVGSSQVLIVHDDLDLRLGRLRLVARGGAGGHRGVRSIIEALGESDLARLKVGIGRPQAGEPIEQFVLEPPYAEHADLFRAAVKRAADAAQAVLLRGLPAAMNQYNRRSAVSDAPGGSVREDAQV